MKESVIRCPTSVAKLSEPSGSELRTTDYGLHRNLRAIEIEGTKLSYCRDGQFVAVEDLPGYSLHIRSCNPVDALEDLVQRELAAEEYFLPSEVAHARRRRFKAEHNRDLELILRALQLG